MCVLVVAFCCITHDDKRIVKGFDDPAWMLKQWLYFYQKAQNRGLSGDGREERVKEGLKKVTDRTSIES